LTRALRDRGWSPGVVSRGYGTDRALPRLVVPNGSANDYGDEPLLIARGGQAPVVVGNDRAAAHACCSTASTRRSHHRRRRSAASAPARNVEIALVHEPVSQRWLLPAGPLREPPRRLDGVDAVVLHGPHAAVRIYSPFFRMTTSIACA